MPSPEESTVRQKAAADYTMRLFMSVDVSGSTAFKFSSSIADRNADVTTSKLGWFSIIKKFYETFHTTFMKLIGDPTPNCTRLWKALGDELIYQAEIGTRDDAAKLIENFISAIKTTRGVVQGLSKGLDLKAAAWIADFPARNAVITVDGLVDQYAVGGGAAATVSEVGIDYIGPSMDTGFRIGKVASRRKMAISVELAAILAGAQQTKQSYPFQFGYDGREELKGVLGGEAYPAVWLDVEDDPKRREAHRREASMLHRQPYLVAETVLDFCVSYIAASKWMEMPYLSGDQQDGLFSTIPDSHIEYASLEIERLEKEAGLYQPADLPPDSIPEDAAMTADRLIDSMPPMLRKLAEEASQGTATPEAGEKRSVPDTSTAQATAAASPKV